MTAPLDTVPDEGPITFKLWLPRWEPTDGGALCRFEATSVGLEALGDGSAESMRQFLADLMSPATLPPDLTVREWHVSRYACPFFSDYPTGTDWEDRLPVAWSVQITTTGTLPDPKHWGPYGSYAHDETALDLDWDWERGNENVAVIGMSSGAEPDALDAIDGIVDTDHIRPWPALRLDLGTLDLPADVDRVDGILAAVREHGLETYWGAAKE